MLLLAGCGASTLPEFEAEQTNRDLIADASTWAPEINPDSTRYVGEVEGAELYLARGEGKTCLVHIRDQEWEQMGCGAGGGFGAELDSGTLIEVGTYKFPEDRVGGEERTKLSESVYVISNP